MSILMAFQVSDIEVIGLTTIFGNVSTKDATRNALLLVRIPPETISTGLLLRP
jgi:uridine nucleosidase